MLQSFLRLFLFSLVNQSFDMEEALKEAELILASISLIDFALAQNESRDELSSAQLLVEQLLNLTFDRDLDTSLVFNGFAEVRRLLDDLSTRAAAANNISSRTEVLNQRNKGAINRIQVIQEKVS